VTAKREYVESMREMGLPVEYIGGRYRDPKGEVNGKSNNLNNCLQNYLYQDYQQEMVEWKKVGS
jgi:hypothetical protein